MSGATSAETSTGVTSATAEWRRRHFRRRALGERDLRSGRVAISFPATDAPPPPRALDARQRRAGELLERLLDGDGVPILHARRIPASGEVVDHVAVGPSGVSLIHAVDAPGRPRVRHGRLEADGHDLTEFVSELEHRRALVRPLLEDARLGALPLRAALCWMQFDSLPFFGQLRIDRTLIDGPRPIARALAAPGPLGETEIAAVADALARAMPPA